MEYPGKPTYSVVKILEPDGVATVQIRDEKIPCPKLNCAYIQNGCFSSKGV